MPPYFYHLHLELYATPTPPSPSPSPSPPSSTSPPSPVYLPPPGTDLFRHPLPVHRQASWTPPRAAVADPGPEDARPRLPAADLAAPGATLLLPQRSTAATPTATATATAATKAAAAAATHVRRGHAEAARDWRFGRVSVEAVDMEPARGGGGGGAGLQTKAVFVPGPPRTTEVGWGVVHLYRDSEESAVLGDARRREGGGGHGHGHTHEHGDDWDASNCTTLCVLAVPSWMMPSDLLGFVGDAARAAVSHFRLVRTAGRANKYMVLMKFRSARAARDWHAAYNGRLFSAAEPENCHVVFVRSVRFVAGDTTVQDDDGGGGALRFPQNQPHDAFTRAAAPPLASSKPRPPPPPPSLLELPTCPVCLERMDETTGLLTILCQHVFHCACLEKWRFPGAGCPVCRYSQAPSATFPFPQPAEDGGGGGDGTVAPAVCATCASDAHLWICLICGHVGCGRYDGAHAFAHYAETSHCFAMDLVTQHVWDYAGDGYVHRLLQSKPTSTGTTTGDEGGGTRHANEAFRAAGPDMVPRDKVDAMATEYASLLTAQLEGQRRYFEEQVERAADKAARAGERAEQAATSARRAESVAAALRMEHEAAMTETRRLEAKLARAETARGRAETLARELTRSVREERAMGEGLMQRIRAAEEKSTAAEAEAAAARERVRALEEENADLAGFISGQERVRQLAAEGEEVAEADVGVTAKKGGTGKRKGKGK